MEPKKTSVLIVSEDNDGDVSKTERQSEKLYYALASCIQDHKDFMFPPAEIQLAALVYQLCSVNLASEINGGPEFMDAIDRMSHAASDVMKAFGYDWINDKMVRDLSPEDQANRQAKA